MGNRIIQNDKSTDPGFYFSLSRDDLLFHRLSSSLSFSQSWKNQFQTFCRKRNKLSINEPLLPSSLSLEQKYKKGGSLLNLFVCNIFCDVQCPVKNVFHSFNLPIILPLSPPFPFSLFSDKERLKIFEKKFHSFQLI